jgi:hypothetical protein
LAAHCQLLHATCYVPAIGGTPSLPASGGICRITGCQGAAGEPAGCTGGWRLAPLWQRAGASVRHAFQCIFSERPHWHASKKVNCHTYMHTQQHKHKHMHWLKHSNTHSNTQTHKDKHTHTTTDRNTDTHTPMRKHRINHFTHRHPFCLKLQSSIAMAKGIANNRPPQTGTVFSRHRLAKYYHSWCASATWHHCRQSLPVHHLSTKPRNWSRNSSRANMCGDVVGSNNVTS